MPLIPHSLAGADAFRSLRQQSERYATDLHRTREQRDEARQALAAARLESLMCLAAALRHKDDDTGAHVVRMGHFSAAIARALGQPGPWAGQLLYASRLHDIGKIGVPDRVLQKRGPLDDGEWALMREHPRIGAAMLCGSHDPLLQMAAEVALQHHERFDGSGYPFGRRAGEIVLAARIVAVADYFDAVTSDRCYRPAMSDAEAFALLREGAGSHFDPEVLAAFFSATRELLALRHAINAGEIEPMTGRGGEA